MSANNNELNQQPKGKETYAEAAKAGNLATTHQNGSPTEHQPGNPTQVVILI